MSNEMNSGDWAMSQMQATTWPRGQNETRDPLMGIAYFTVAHSSADDGSNLDEFQTVEVKVKFDPATKTWAVIGVYGFEGRP